jgi:hypothetical protein
MTENKVYFYANKENKTIEFISQEWRFALFFDDPIPSFAFASKFKDNELFGEELPDDVMDALRYCLQNDPPTTSQGA